MGCKNSKVAVDDLGTSQEWERGRKERPEHIPISKTKNAVRPTNGHHKGHADEHRIPSDEKESHRLDGVGDPNGLAKHVIFDSEALLPAVRPTAPDGKGPRGILPQTKPPRPTGTSNRASAEDGRSRRSSDGNRSIEGVDPRQKSRVRFAGPGGGAGPSRPTSATGRRTGDGDARNKTIGTLTSWQLIAAEVMQDMARDGNPGGGARRSAAGGSVQSRATGPGGPPALGIGAFASGDNPSSNDTSETAIPPGRQLQGGGRPRSRSSADAEDEDEDPQARNDIFASIKKMQWKSFSEEYELGRTIGAGAYGKAVECTRRSTGDRFVVKVVDTRGMSLKSRLEVRNEVRVLSQLSHPNIVQYIEAFFEDGTLYIVMELCEEGDLTSFIKKRRGHLLPEDDVMRIFVQICLGLAHTHSEGVLHRDMKPSNILLSKGSIVKLADFGIARVMSGKEKLAKTVVGTPYYLSPEICEDRPYGVSSDMWSLGCVLYELCALKRPFEGTSFPSLIVRILNGKYPPIPSSYSEDLHGVIEALLQRDPDARPTLDDILSLEFVKEHLQTYAMYIKSVAPKRLSSFRRTLEPRLGAATFDSDQAGPRPTDSDNADGEGEGADNNAEGGEGGAGAESVYDPYGGANNNNGAPRVSRKSRLSIASTAHKGGARSASEDVDGDVDGDGAGDADSLDLSRTRDALKQLENDRLLGRVAKSRKLANKVESMRHLAPAIHAMDEPSALEGGMRRRNSYTGGEMRKVVSRHIHRDKVRRPSQSFLESSQASSAAQSGILAKPPPRAAAEAGQAAPVQEQRAPWDTAPQFKSTQVPLQHKSFIESMSFGKTASEGIVDVSNLPTPGNKVPLHRGNSRPGIPSSAATPAGDSHGNSRAVSRRSSVNSRQAGTVLKQVSTYLARPSQKYISRASMAAANHLVSQASGSMGNLVGATRARPLPAIAGAASFRALGRPPVPAPTPHDVGPGDPRLRAVARIDSRIAAGRIYERGDDAAVYVDLDATGTPRGKGPSRTSHGDDVGSNRMAILSALSDGGDVSPLESIEKLTVTALQDRIREAKAECARYIPMPLVEAAVAYIRAINPGGTVTSSTTSSAPAGGYSDDTFRRMVGEDNVDKISNLVYKICVYQESLAEDRTRDPPPAPSASSSARSLTAGMHSSGRSAAQSFTSGHPSGPSKVSSIASEVIPEDEETPTSRAAQHADRFRRAVTTGTAAAVAGRDAGAEDGSRGDG